MSGEITTDKSLRGKLQLLNSGRIRSKEGEEGQKQKNSKVDCKIREIDRQMNSL